MKSATTIAAHDLAHSIGTAKVPLVFDVRRRPVYDAAERMIAGALWRDHAQAREWAREIPPGTQAVVYCVHGHNVSELAASVLRAQGVAARVLEGGFEAYAASGGPTIRRTEWHDPAAGRPSRWVTRARPKIDRVACPWLIRRFIDRQAEILFVAAEWVREAAAEAGASPFDIPDVAFGHVGERCSFDTFLDLFGVEAPGLRELAVIVRAADTDRHALSAQAPGLLAASLGLSLLYDDDHEQLEAGMALYDAFYAWCRSGRGEKHDWKPETMVQAEARR